MDDERVPPDYTKQRKYYRNHRDAVLAAVKSRVAKMQQDGICIKCRQHHERGTQMCEVCQWVTTLKRLAPKP
jgi:hypothetical protein